MNNMNFVKGMGLGIIVGSAIGMAMAPKRHSKNRVGCMLRSVGEVIENFGEGLGM